MIDNILFFNRIHASAIPKEPLVWHNNTHWVRQKLVNEGILSDKSQRGYWELSENPP